MKVSIIEEKKKGKIIITKKTVLSNYWDEEEKLFVTKTIINKKVIKDPDSKIKDFLLTEILPPVIGLSLFAFGIFLAFHNAHSLFK